METDDMRRTELPPPGGLMTTAEAADELGISAATMLRMIRAGAFRVYQPSPRRMWLFKKDVMAHKRRSVRAAS